MIEIASLVANITFVESDEMSVWGVVTFSLRRLN